VLKVLRKGLGLTNSQQELDIKILTVNSWVMHAQVAKNFTNSDENIMLAGDAAHRFPPAGLLFFIILYSIVN
jgi:2-polyprenyl-6-methoxyphenol hydroxylase-like FAD-dependent oxidoreductase